MNKRLNSRNKFRKDLPNWVGVRWGEYIVAIDTKVRCSFSYCAKRRIRPPGGPPIASLPIVHLDVVERLFRKPRREVFEDALGPER